MEIKEYKGQVVMTFRGQLFDYVKKKYKADPKYLWKCSLDCALFRHTDNEKWFGLVLNIKK